MTYEEILSHLGDFKRYQKIQCLLLFPPCMVTAMHVLAFVFTGATPSHRCFTDSLCGLNESVPWDDNKKAYSSCMKYTVEDNTSCDAINKTEVRCNHWVYDDTIYKTTLTTEWDLVCDAKYLKAVAQSIYMFGMLVGAIVLGDLSDRFGRKKILYLSLVIQVVAGFLAAFVPEYITFVLLRFILGAAHSGVILTAFVIAMEFVGPRGKVIAGICPHFWFALGYGTLAILAYFIRDWAYLQIALTATGVLFLPYWWLIPESARWLIQKGRHDEAIHIIKHAANINNVTIPEHLFKRDNTEEKVEKATWVDLLTYGARLRRSALILYYNWFVVSLVYYGLSLTTNDLPGGDPFIKLMLSGAVELISFIFLLLFMNRPGRKFCLCFSMCLSGFTCIAAAFIPSNEGYNWLIQVLSYTGKAAAGAGFVLVYNFSCEIFPTVARNSGVGFSSMCARVGGCITPFVSLLGAYTSLSVPVSIFGGISLVAGLLVLLLPETARRPIPETLAEAEAFGLTFGKLPMEEEKIHAKKKKVPTATLR